MTWSQERIVKFRLKIERRSRLWPLNWRAKSESWNAQSIITVPPSQQTEGGGVVTSILPPFEVALLFYSLMASVGAHMVLKLFYVLCYYLGTHSSEGGVFANYLLI